MKLTAAIIFICLGALSGAQEQTPPATILPAYAVFPEFILFTLGSPKNNRVTFVSADDKANQPYFGYIKFRSAALQSGDEILSINGKAVGAMKPRECIFTLLAAKPETKITLEVRQPNSKDLRKVLVVRVVRESEHVKRVP